MERQTLTEEEIQKFLNGCEDLMQLGATFTLKVRNAFLDLRKTYDPVLKSNYVDKSAAELLTHTLDQFEKKMDVNLDAINRVCTKGGKWFTFFLGKSLGIASQRLHPQNGSGTPEPVRAADPSDAATQEIQQAKKAGV
jgi:hypothetical protein